MPTEKRLRPHAYAELFPAMEGEDYARLRDDIAERGLIQPITLFEGLILDGRNRYNVCCELGKVAEMIEYVGPDPLGYVIAQNLHRRHLSDAQRAIAAAKLATLPPGRQNKTAPHDAFTQAQAGKLLNVSRRSVQRASIVRDKGLPEITERLERGEVSVNVAAKVADLPREAQGRLVNATEGEMRTAIKKHRRVERERDLATATYEASQKLGSELFPVIYADPPWKFETRSEAGMDRAADNHYPTLTTDDICEITVPAADNAALFLWATVPMLLDAIDVMEAWGFRYSTHLIWEKDRIGTGYWSRNKHELLLIGVKGSIPAPSPGDQPASIIAAHVGKHSEKPDVFREVIEDMFPTLPRLEMFARERHEGWVSWGNEIEAAEAAE